MSELSPEARSFFDRAREETRPTGTERQTMLERIERQAAPSSVAPSMGGKVLGGFGIGLSVALLTWLAAPRRTAVVEQEHTHAYERRTRNPGAGAAPERGVVAAGAPEVAVTVRNLGPQPHVQASLVVREARPATDARAPRGTEDDGQLDDPLELELALLRSAQQARVEGRFDDAEHSLREHAKRFSHGSLVPEREIEWARVACERGDLARGRSLAGPYLASAWGGRLRVSCRMTDGP